MCIYNFCLYSVFSTNHIAIADHREGKNVLIVAIVVGVVLVLAGVGTYIAISILLSKKYLCNPVTPSVGANEEVANEEVAIPMEEELVVTGQDSHTSDNNPSSGGYIYTVKYT